MTIATAEAPWQVQFKEVEQRCDYILTTGQWSDCSFQVCSETNKVVVPAHKLILAMASPVFDKMFFGEQPEKNEMISVSKVQPNTFRALLQYIYTGKTDITSIDSAIELWLEGKKYLLPHLEQKCKSYICSVVSPKNACQVYELACQLEEKGLMDLCIQIISSNTKEVLNDRSFMNVKFDTLLTIFSLDHLDLDNELDLFKALVKYDKAQRMLGQSSNSPADSGPPEIPANVLEPSTSEEKDLLENVEGSSQNSTSVELNSKKPPEEVPSSEPTADKEDLKKGEELNKSIKEAIKKIRFLSLNNKQFAEGPAQSCYLDTEERYAVLVNIAAEAIVEPMPNGLSDCWKGRQRNNKGNQEPKAEPLPKTESRDDAATKLPTPAQIIKDLSSSDKDTLKRAVRAARLMTAEEPSEKVDKLVAAGLIRLLVTVLSQPWSSVQYDAGWALTNIAQEHYTDAIVFSGAVLKLVDLVRRGGELAEQAALALGHIAQTDRSAVVNAGALTALITHMKTDTPPTQLKTYLWAYGNICEHEPRFALVSPVLPHIKNLLALENEQILVEACSVLFYLTGGQHQNFNPFLFTPELTSRLTALLGHAEPRVQTAALVALQNVLAHTELMDQCLKGVLDHMNNLLQSGNSTLVEDAAQVAAAILSGTPLQIQKALDQRILDPLAKLLTEGNARCKVQAVLAVSALCSQGSAPQLLALAHSAALEPYSRLLARTGCSCDVLRGLTHLLQNVEKNAVEALSLKLIEFGVAKQLMSLKENEDELVLERSNHLLQTYLVEDEDNEKGRL